jgi:hypothetical protein
MNMYERLTNIKNVWHINCGVVHSQDIDWMIDALKKKTDGLNIALSKLDRSLNPVEDARTEILKALEE